MVAREVCSHILTIGYLVVLVNCIFNYGNYKIEIVVVCCLGKAIGRLCCVLLDSLFYWGGLTLGYCIKMWTRCSGGMPAFQK